MSLRRFGKITLAVILVWLGLGLAVEVARTVAQDDESADGPTDELCASVRDLLDSLKAAGRNPSASNLDVVDADYRTLTREANRSPGGFSSEASTARIAWSEFRAANNVRDRSTSEIEDMWGRALTPLVALKDECFPDD